MTQPSRWCSPTAAPCASECCAPRTSASAIAWWWTVLCPAALSAISTRTERMRSGPWLPKSAGSFPSWSSSTRTPHLSRTARSRPAFWTRVWRTNTVQVDILAALQAAGSMQGIGPVIRRTPRFPSKSRHEPQEMWMLGSGSASRKSIRASPCSRISSILYLRAACSPDWMQRAEAPARVSH